MQLTVIIVNWNTREMLKECISSVFSTIDRLTTEIIIVDNASDDGSHEMVETEFSQAILIKNSWNKGFAVANNQALRIASGTYLLLLNSDTIVHGDVISRSVRYLEEHGRVGAMGCRVLNTDGSLQPTCSRFPSLLNLILQTSGLCKLPWPKFLDRYQMLRWERTDEREVEVISGCYLMARADAISEVGLLDENFFFFGEETDLCLRFQEAGWKLCFAPVGEITHHGGGSVNKLNHKRDLMLSSATVKLHLKHGGVMSGLAAWAIIFIFHLSRALYWTILSWFTRSENARTRGNHFLSLLRDSRQIWPTNKTFKP